MKDLTISNIERQNVLNNRFAVSKVQKHLDIEGILFEGEYRFTKKMEVLFQFQPSRHKRAWRCKKPVQK